MTNNPQLFHKRRFKFQNPLESNPQLFREIKGKISGKSIFIISLLSILTQVFIIAFYLGKLPDLALKNSQHSRYCTGARGEYYSEYLCKSELGIWQINWELFWHDIFIFVTISSIFILLIIGIFMIIADLVKEEKTGTLNFIRLSPQSASNIFLGKILGVPILVYFFIATIFPLHFISGLKVNIPWYLILFFDLIVITSCALFYSFAVLFSLAKIAKVELKPWIASFFVAFFLWITTTMFFVHDGVSIYLIEYPLLFNPVIALAYLLDPISAANYPLLHHIDIEYLSAFLFYEQPLLGKISTGMSFFLFNYCLWTYWLWQGATRLFHNPASTILRKNQSYWLTGWFVVIALGFTLQNIYDSIIVSFILLQCLLLVMFLGLVGALSPHRQKLYDWARYRHQISKEGKLLWKELVFEDQSPSTVAIAINVSIAAVIIAIALLLFPFKELGTNVIWGLFLTVGIILLYAVIAQWMLLMKSSKRGIWTFITISSLIIIPPILLAIAEITPQQAPLIWLFSFIPTVAIGEASISALILGVLGQWLAIACVSFLMIRKLRQAGRSETKKLLKTH